MTVEEGAKDTTRGFLLGVAAYAMWGLFPLYWPLLKPAGAPEILAHRVVWSLFFVLAVLFATNRKQQLVDIIRNPRQRTILAIAAAVVAVNWGTYIWGVNEGNVVETALGYFINPLVTVLMGVFILHEQMRPMQWVAVGIASIAIVVIAVNYGRPPWVALILAFSFGTYGLAKKKADAGAIESLTYETMVLTPLALGYLVVLGVSGHGHFLDRGVGYSALLVLTGIVTAVPLMCFGAAAIRVQMTTIGLLQYIAPILQFIIGVAVLHEHMNSARWIGFGLVWVALAIFTFEAIRYHRSQLRLAAEASAA